MKKILLAINLLLLLLMMFSSTLVHDYPGECKYKLKDLGGKNERRIVMQRDVLVKHLPIELEQKANYTQILNIDLELEKDKDRYFVTLYNNFISNKVFKSYGVIQNSTKIKVQLYNDKHIYLQHLGNSELITTPSGSVEFASGFSLKENAIKLLMKYEIVSIGIFWVSGYESYEVYNMDLLRDQLSCIQKL